MAESPNDDSGDLLQLAEIAKKCRVSLSTARYWRSKKLFPVVKVGRHPLVRRKDFEAFLERGLEGGAADGKRGKSSNARA